MILIHQIQGRNRASNIYNRNKKYKNKTKTEHACIQSDPTKQTSGP